MSERVFTLEEVEEVVKSARVPWIEQNELELINKVRAEIIRCLHEMSEKSTEGSALVYEEKEGFSLAAAEITNGK